MLFLFVLLNTFTFVQGAKRRKKQLLDKKEKSSNVLVFIDGLLNGLSVFVLVLSLLIMFK